MKLAIPILIILTLAGIGAGAGILLAPTTSNPENQCLCEEANQIETEIEPEATSEGDTTPIEVEYVNLKNQFVIPVVSEGKMTGMVVMSVSLEVDIGTKEVVYSREPKIRDEFLSLLFAYSNIGGFAGNYLQVKDLDHIRNDLTNAAKSILGPIIHEVLIVDMVRQEL